MHPYNFNSIQNEQNMVSNNLELLHLFDKHPGDQYSNLSMNKMNNNSQNEQHNEAYKPKSRQSSLNKAEKRAEHNAIERARRECLNYKFQQLAMALPNLQNHRRPSKGQIVEKALDWVKQNISKEDKYRYQIIQLQNENKRLLNQLNNIQENSKSKSTSPVSNTCPTPTFINDSNANQQMVLPYYQDTITNAYPTPNMDWLNYQQQQSLMFNNQSPMEIILPSKLSPLNLVPNEEDNESNSSNEDPLSLNNTQLFYHNMPIPNVLHHTYQEISTGPSINIQNQTNPHATYIL